MRGPRRGLLVLTAMLAAAPPARADVTLSTGHSAFWDGPYVASARVDDAGLCDHEGPCFRYPLRVTSAGAAELRVGLDQTDESNGWELRLLDPDGKVAGDDTTYQEGGLGERLDAEVHASKPKPGLWTIEVVPQNVVHGDFRLRAKLEGPTCVVPDVTGLELTQAKTALTKAGCTIGSITRQRKATRVALQKPAAQTRSAAHVRLSLKRKAPAAKGVVDTPPDIAPDPPWHLTFAQPLPQVVTEGGNLTALVGVHNPVAQVAGQPVYQCLPEETVEQQAHRCLRFSSGVASIGTGRFEVYGAAPVPVALNGGPLFQVVGRSDGSTRTREAGTFTFHKVHAHYHVLDLALFPLFRVDGDHTLVPAGRGLKEGFCLGNLKLYDWRSFAQDFVDPNTIDNCEPSPDPSGIAQIAPDAWRFYEGIAAGWEDVYTWATSGQFVDFGDNPDGRYVLRMGVNTLKTFEENDYDDNVAYTYFQVRGNDVRVLERGRGTDPWDPHKVVLDPEITR